MHCSLCSLLSVLVAPRESWPSLGMRTLLAGLTNTTVLETPITRDAGAAL
jgi:hypothetical protein